MGFGEESYIVGLGEKSSHCSSSEKRAYVTELGEKSSHCRAGRRMLILQDWEKGSHVGLEKGANIVGLALKIGSNYF